MDLDCFQSLLKTILTLILYLEVIVLGAKMAFRNGQSGLLRQVKSQRQLKQCEAVKY